MIVPSAIVPIVYLRAFDWVEESQIDMPSLREAKIPHTYSFRRNVIVKGGIPQAYLLTNRRWSLVHTIEFSSFFHTPHMQQTQNMLNISSTDSLMSDGFTVYTSPQFLFSIPQRTPSPQPFEQNVLPSNCFR